jgi:hypothetical protein
MKALRFTFLLLTSALSGCVGNGAPGLDEQTLFAAQIDQGRRLAGESLRVRSRLMNLDLALTVAASDFCGALTRPKLGGVFGSSTGFTGAASRAVVEESFGLSEDPTIIYVTPKGPLAVGEIQPGDRILAVNGQAVDSLQKVDQLVSASPQRVELTLGRGDQELRRTVVPAAACPVTLDYSVSSVLVPWKVSKLSGGVPLGLMNLLDDDDELAMILGHQLAHLLFERAEDDRLAHERRADRFGLFIAARAGYDVKVAERAWEKLAFEYPWLITTPPPTSIFSRYPHNSLAQRMEGIRATVREIDRLRAQGRPLVPRGD